MEAFANYFTEIKLPSMLLTALLLAAVVALVLWYRREMQPRMGTLEWIQTYDKPKFTLDGRRFPMERKDILPMAILIAVYAVVAFTNLGSTVAPQSFYTFTEDNSSVEIDLGDTQLISGVMYYTGLYPGDYDLYFSANGFQWVRIEGETDVVYSDGTTGYGPAMPQSYADLFKWLYAKMDVEPVYAQYVRVEARNLPMELGELALYDEYGTLIDVTGVDSVLLDEQSTVPESPSWFNSMYFDEIYHGRTAYENIKNVEPYEVTHPPLGKLLIALGIEIFGMTPFGYRFMGTFFGVLMLLPFYVLLKSMFGKTKVALCGTAIFAFEFMHFTQTRIATIDTYGVFFTVTSFLFLWRWATAPYDLGMEKTWLDLFLAGLSFGIGCACKWTVLYAGVGLAALWLLRVFCKYREGGLSGYGWELVGTVGLSIVFFVTVPALIYTLSYIPYGFARDMRFPGMLANNDYYRMVWDNQVYMLTYHSGVDQYHPYSSRWYQWVFDLRPILYYLDYADTTKQAFGAFNSPLVSWAGLAAIFAMVPAFVERRKPAAIVIWLGYFSQIIPWVLITRTTFAYHYFGSSAFLVLAISYILDELLSRNPKNDRIAYAVTGAELGLFALFYPVLTGVSAGLSFCQNFLKWFPSWPF